MEPGNAGAFDNLFDRGPVVNCVQFWGSWGAVDWGPIYHERWQVRAWQCGVASQPHFLLKCASGGCLVMTVDLHWSRLHCHSAELDHAVQPRPRQFAC